MLTGGRERKEFECGCDVGKTVCLFLPVLCPLASEQKILTDRVHFVITLKDVHVSRF